MIGVVLAGILAAVVAPFLTRVLRGWTGWVWGCGAWVLAGYFSIQAASLADGVAVQVRYPWIPTLGVGLSFYLDGLSLLFALLISVIGGVIFVYAGGYLKGDPLLGRFFAYLTLFMVSMIGVVTSGNLLSLFVFWELTSLSSYMLIGFEHHRERARASALQALLVTGSGGLALLAGFILLGQAAGSYELADLTGLSAKVRDSGLYGGIVVLVLLGAFTKSAQFPFHFWLPNAMEAPSPVSAYLHSATMVKAGVFLMARLMPVLGGTALWSGSLIVFGSATMLLASVLALRQTELKKILAYTTVGVLGTLTMTLGIGGEAGIRAAVVYLLAHSFYKAALFMLAGNVLHGTGSQNLESLGGLRNRMPVSFAVGLLAVSSMIGLPPFLGFLGKELLYESVIHAGGWGLLLIPLVIVSGVLMSCAGANAGFRAFMGPVREDMEHAHEATGAMNLGPVLLAVLGLAAGIFSHIPEWLLTEAASAIAGRPVEAHLHLWHGFNVVLVLSALTFAGVVVSYLYWPILRERLDVWGSCARYGPERCYESGLEGLKWLAKAQTSVIQSGSLRAYLTVILLTTIGLVALAAVKVGFPGFRPHWTNLHAHELVVTVVMVIAALGVTRANSRTSAIMLLGVVGYGAVVIYAMFGAPDLAMTQFAIETLSVMLFVLVLYRLPRFARLTHHRERRRSALVAVAGGVMMTFFVLRVQELASPSRLTPFFAEASLLEAKGRNVVNVILVDFRGIDTLGEITVLSVAALGIFALLRLKLEKRP